MTKTPYTIKSFDHCELYVGNAKQSSHFYQFTMGFNLIAYQGLETGNRESVSYVLNQGLINLVLTSPLIEDTKIGRHIDVHGDGMKNISFSVDNATIAWEESIRRGAINEYEPKVIKDENGEAIISAIRTFGDTIHSFVERKHYNGPFLPGFISIKNEKVNNDMGLIHIDHVVGNQPDGEMKNVCDFYEEVLGWHRFWSVDDKDINTQYSSLRSVVMANNNEKIKIPINEPADGLKKSQIQEFIDFYNSSGVQHLALSTKNIIDSVKKYQKTKIHNSTKIFQALRILVNKEISELINALINSFHLIPIGGVIAVVTFHSIEDKIVKFFFKHYSEERNSSRYMPNEEVSEKCFKIIDKKPILPGLKEISQNPPSRSAKLRYGIKINHKCNFNDLREKFKYLTDVEELK